MDRRSFLFAAGLSLLPLPLWAADDPDDEAVGVKDALPQAVEEGALAPVVFAGERLALLQTTHERITRVRRTVGYGNFNLLGFDDMLSVARNYSRVGAFTRAELALIDELFHADATRYGFFGSRVFNRLSDKVPAREVDKVGRTGHYLYRGHASAMYERIKADVGAERIVLTSGVRSNVKQLHLFLGKVLETGGNLSLASRSLAPPGYSFHGIGDFDVGKIGFGYRNFTEAFAGTPEYATLIHLGYIAIRYPNGNPDGVRFEPWHIKVV